MTGAAAGLGRAIALALEKDGFSVFGTTRQPPDRATTTEFPLLRLDVRSDDSVRAALDQVRSVAGGLDVLVNNAGFRFLGAAEETSVDEARAVFETNFFGAHRVTVAALALLREAGAARITPCGWSQLEVTQVNSYHWSKCKARMCSEISPPRGSGALLPACSAAATRRGTP